MFAKARYFSELNTIQPKEKTRKPLVRTHASKDALDGWMKDALHTASKRTEQTAILVGRETNKIKFA